MKLSKKITVAVAIALLLPACIVIAVDFTGTSGDDTLTGTNASDNIDGKEGNDTIKGQSGNDVIDGGDGNDNIEGGFGEDTIKGGVGDDTIKGDDADDDIEGGPGTDTIEGGNGNDKIRGGAGNDTIDGGNGNDKIIPGPGLDTYTVRVNDGKDRITIRAGDVPAGQTETVLCGSGKDRVKLMGFRRRDRLPNAANGSWRFKDPDTGGIYEIETGCERKRWNDEFAFYDSHYTPSTTVGSIGTAVAISGEDFPPGATIVVSFAEKPSGEFQTDDFGDFQATFDVPNIEADTYRVSFTNEDYAFGEEMYFTVVEEPYAGGITRLILVAAGFFVLGALIGMALFRKR